MSISRQVKERVVQIGPDVIFGVEKFSNIGHMQAVSLALSRLSQQGFIERIMKGKYFLPKSSRFGKVRPSESQILTSVLEENGGYVAGVLALNRIGVTTQIPSEIVIRGARSTRTKKIGHLVIRLLRQGNVDAVQGQSKLTDIIEAIRLIKKTPDGSRRKTLQRVQSALEDLAPEDVRNLVVLLENERPYVRAILGALFERSGFDGAEEIKAMLNPLTKYYLGISSELLPNGREWGIA